MKNHYHYKPQSHTLLPKMIILAVLAGLSYVFAKSKHMPTGAQLQAVWQDFVKRVKPKQILEEVKAWNN